MMDSHRRLVRFDLAYEVYQNARVSFDWHYVGERFTDPVETVALEAYSYVNLGAQYSFENEWIHAWRKGFESHEFKRI